MCHGHCFHPPRGDSNVGPERLFLLNYTDASPVIRCIVELTRAASGRLTLLEPHVCVFEWVSQVLPVNTETITLAFAGPSRLVTGRIELSGVSSMADPSVVAAAQVMVSLYAAKVEAELQAAEKERDRLKLAAVAADSEQRFRILADTMPQIVWSTLPDGYHDYYNKRWYDFTGVPEGTTDGEGWNGMFHPDDQDRAWSRWRHSLATGDPYEIEYRLRDANGDYRWTLGRASAMRDETGKIVRWFGTCTDIHEQRLLLEQRQLVSQELSHRIKNIFSIIAGLTSLSRRRHPEAAPILDDIRERILALGRAHDFVRPHSAASAPQHGPATLAGLLGELLAPYQSDTHPRIEICGDDLPIDDQATTPIALVFHELATNAAKYGALSTERGHVRLEVSAEPDICVCRWLEFDGPEIANEPQAPGFGTSLVDLSITRQLGGTIVKSWDRGGLTAHITIPRSALQRSGVK